VRLKNRKLGGCSSYSRRRHGIGIGGLIWTGLFVMAALLTGGYFVVQGRLGHGLQLGRNVTTPTVELTITPTRGVNDFLEVAAAAEARGDYRAAIDALDKASRRKPNDINLYWRAARLMVFIGQPEKAEQRVRKGLDIDPNHLPSRAVLCMALEWQKHLKEAIDECTAVTAADPKFSNGYAYLAEAQADSGNFDAALSAAQTAVDLDPSNPDALRNLGYIYDVFGKYDQAMYHYNRALDKAPNMPHVMNAIGRVYLLENNADNAVKTFQRVIAMDAGNDEAYYLLGGAYQYQGEFGKAALALDKAVELNPLRLRAWTRRGEVHFAEHKFFPAAEDYSQAITVSLQLSQSLTALDYLNYGFALQWIQECDKAVEMWTRSAALATGNSDIQDSINVGLRRCGRK